MKTLLLALNLHAVAWNPVPCDHYEVQSSADLRVWAAYDYPTNAISFITFNQPRQFFRVRAWNGIESSDWATVTPSP